MDLLDRFLGHDAWTTACLLQQSRALTDEQLDHEFDLGWRTVRATLEHIIDNIETWVDLMNGGPLRKHPEPTAYWLTLGGLSERLTQASHDLAVVARRVQVEGRMNDTWVDFLDEPPCRKTYGGAITHVITHSMHHRAQLIDILRKLGVKDVIEGDALSWEQHTTGA
ncbi:DinB family protein [Deinococcus marmoris]|uniref:DinB family protein n=1 Tax=Deinococcus marmoris TaxID=249408 RepID=UPI0004979FBE|nr:DinB family protein [Deinococcus marmoris]